MVMARSTGTRSISAPRATATWRSARSGRYLATGSLSRNRPSSHNIIAATEVMGLVME
jgi:hypothetical protein